MLKRILIAAVLLAVTGSGLYAQSTKLKRAQKYMNELNYIGAIEVYNQVLENEDNAEAKKNVAECYRKIGDSENAEYWYGQVVGLADAEPIHKLYYGQALQRNGKCDLAKDWYNQFVEAVPDDIRGKYLQKACDYEEELMTKNAGIYEIKHPEFNSNLDDFGPVYYQNGLVFASERDKGSVVSRTHSWTGNPFLELFLVEVQESGGDEVEGVCGNFMYGRAEKYNPTLNTKYHDAAVSFNADESVVFYTQNNLEGKDDEGVIRLKVFSANSDGDGGWGELEGLPFNSDEYSVAHPTLTPDGERLFFASDMPGGFGGMDLYVSEQENGRWGPPNNLGPSINTEGNEVFPYYEKNGRLYFTSDGQVGLGGLDIYYMDDKGNSNWGPIENMGYPINTMSDDFSIIFNDEGTCGYFSSDRAGGAGHDDIYSFKKIAVPIEVFVFDAKTGVPIEGAVVMDECTGSSLLTGSDGKVTVDMKINECCTFTASMDTYENNEKEGCTTGDLSERVIVDIPLDRALKFDLEGIVYDSESGLPIEGATVTITNSCDEEEDVVLTDSDGRYYFELEPDCCYSVKGELEGYAADVATDQCTDQLTESTTLQANLNLMPALVPNISVDNIDEIYERDGLYYKSGTEQAFNGTAGGVTYEEGRPTESGGWQVSSGIEHTASGEPIPYLLHIYYDFNQSYIRDEAESELTKLYELLVSNPDYIVEVGAHTDSRGSHRYNKRLSQRRSESVVRWLVKMGVERDRLVARGYGETMNVNDCANNIPCSERQHQMNRRTEFRVLGCRNCVDDARVSQPNDDPQVDPCQGCPF